MSAPVAASSSLAALWTAWNYSISGGANNTQVSAGLQEMSDSGSRMNVGTAQAKLLTGI